MNKARAHLLPSRKSILLVFSILLCTVAPSWLAIAQRRGSSRILNKPATPLGWYVFKGPDGDFSLAFPAKPQPFESDVEGPVTTIRHYHLSTKDGKYFSVNIQDMGGDPRSRDANEFDPNNESTVAAAARERGERVVQVHRLAKSVFEMEVWQPVKGTPNKLHRLDYAILRRGRMYTLGCGSLIDNQEVDKSTCRKFFKSIRFTK
jgi:hypothetical protein